MRIGILSREYPPLTHVGGIATYSQTAARLLAANGHAVEVVSHGPAPSIERDGGITVHRVPMLAHHFPRGRWAYPWRAWYRKRLPHYLDALTWARTAAAYIAGLPAEGAGANFDLWEYPETMGEGALFPRPRGAPPPALVCRVHTGWMDALADNAWERRALLRLQRRACLQADRIVSPSAFMAGAYLRETLGVGKPALVSPNPMRLWDAPIDWSAKSLDHLLYVGRVEHRKGLTVLLKALDLLGEAARGITLRVVGDIHPPTRPADRECVDFFRDRLAARPGERGRGAYALEYAGPCGHADMPRHYDWAGLLAIPSLMENHPYAALEGLSRGCYLIASDAGGLPEIVDGPGRGELFPAENSAALARKIGECRRRDRLIPDGLRVNAERMRQHFAPEASYARLMQAYGTEQRQGSAG